MALETREIAVSIDCSRKSETYVTANNVFEGPKRLKTATNPEQAQVTNREGEASEPAGSAVLASNNKRQSQLFVTEDEPDDEAEGKGMYPWLSFSTKADDSYRRSLGHDRLKTCF